MLGILPSSTFIRSADPVGEPLAFEPDCHGDLWPMSWADDHRLYAAVGDGWGFDRPKRCNLLCESLMVDLERRALVGHEVAPAYFERFGEGGTEPNPKPTGMLARGRSLYLFVQDLRPTWTTGVGVDTRLLVSHDLGQTWHEMPAMFPDRFTTPTFLQAGQGYQDAEDDYAYLYSPKYNWFEEDELFLARVPLDEIETRAAYEFFAGAGEEWTRDIDRMQPVLVNPPRYVSQCEVVYIKAIDRYIMAQWRLGTRERNPFNDHYSELYLCEAPRPWGPWALFHHDKHWGENSLDYRYCGRIPANLIDSDGLAFYLQYAGWSAVRDPAATRYGFNLQKYRLTLA